MHRKSFLFGFGVSMIMVSALYYLIYQIDVRRIVRNYSETLVVEQLTDDEIRERAKKLGMLTVSELPNSSVTENLTDDEIMQRAEELGMVMDLTYEEASDDSTIEDIPTDSEPVEQADANEDETDYVNVTIPQGTPSSRISQILFEAGLIPDAKEFDRYTVEKNLARRIRYGEFSIPKNATSDEILDIIKR